MIRFFFNDTAPPEIYTYRHTLSLHDALPLSTPFRRPRRIAQQHLDADERAQGQQRQQVGEVALGDVAEGQDGHARARRSEEHTSELQSLMRISYAVFCLKKQTSSQMRKQGKRSKHYSQQTTAQSYLQL